MTPGAATVFIPVHVDSPGVSELDESAAGQAALVSFLRDAVGGELRTILQYDQESFDFLYAREDAIEKDSAEDAQGFVEDLRNAETSETRRTDLHNIGDHHATVRVYDESVLIHFPQGDDVGTLVTVDPSAAGNLTGFLAACLDYLRRTDQEIEHAPEWL